MILSEKSAERTDEVESLGPQLADPVKGNKRREALPGEDEDQVNAADPMVFMVRWT